ncbi:MAG: hypothetical protein IJ240_04000 [Clostridia bacterium]|nr:hypothetical protein [Clostridia bacterium]
MEKEKPLIVLEAHYNKRNHSRCELYPDRLELFTESTGGLLPIYENKARTIPLRDIRRTVISNGGMGFMGFLSHHPNAIHFITRPDQRPLDDLFRDAAFKSASYIDEGVQQFCAKTNAELTEKLAVATRIRDYIEQYNAADPSS